MRTSKFMLGLMLLLGGISLKSLQEKEGIFSCQQESVPTGEDNSTETSSSAKKSVPIGDDNSTEEKKLEEPLYTNNAAMPTGTEMSWAEKITIGYLCLFVLGLVVIWLYPPVKRKVAQWRRTSWSDREFRKQKPQEEKEGNVLTPKKVVQDLLKEQLPEVVVGIICAFLPKVSVIGPPVEYFFACSGASPSHVYVERTDENTPNTSIYYFKERKIFSFPEPFEHKDNKPIGCCFVPGLDRLVILKINRHKECVTASVVCLPPDAKEKRRLAPSTIWTATLRGFPRKKQHEVQLHVDEQRKRIVIVCAVSEEPKTTHIWVYAYNIGEKRKSVTTNELFYGTIDNRALFPSDFCWVDENTLKIIHKDDMYSMTMANQGNEHRNNAIPKENLREILRHTTCVKKIDPKKMEVTVFRISRQKTARENLPAESLIIGINYYIPDPQEPIIVTVVYFAGYTTEYPYHWNLLLYNLKTKEAKFALKEFQPPTISGYVPLNPLASCVMNNKEDLLFFLQRTGERLPPCKLKYVCLPEGIPREVNDVLPPDVHLLKDIRRITAGLENSLVVVGKSENFCYFLYDPSLFQVKQKKIAPKVDDEKYENDDTDPNASVVV